MGRQIGAIVLGAFIFYAFIAAMSRLLMMKEVPDYIENITSGIANLYNGAFGK